MFVEEGDDEVGKNVAANDAGDGDVQNDDDDRDVFYVDDSATGTYTLPASATRGVQLILQPSQDTWLGWVASSIGQASW